MSAKHINSFCVDRNEKFIFYGNKLGEIFSAKIDDFKIISKSRTHYGNIHTMCAHAQKNIIAALSQDRSISLWLYDEEGNISLICQIPTRDYTTDELTFVASESQAIALHSSDYKVATRSGNGHLIEFDFTLAGEFNLIKCLRPFEALDNGNMNDIVTIRYIPNSDRLLVGGGVGAISLIEENEIIKRWKFDDAPIHWFEPITHDIFYIASDARRVFRLDLAKENNNLLGEIIAHDDIEHVTFNSVSGKLYASSFDRNVYTISLDNCQKTEIVHSAPYQLRWIKTLKTQPNWLLVQCRNGGLYKVDIKNNTVIQSIRNMRDAIWTGVSAKNKLYLAGEGNEYLCLEYQGTTELDGYPSFSVQRNSLPNMAEAYVKRMALHQEQNLLAFGYSNGKIILADNNETWEVYDFGLAVRDIIFSQSAPLLYAISESGTAVCIDVNKQESYEIFKADDTLWSLALNEERKILAIGQRNGYVYFINTQNSEKIGESISYRPKRMKWLDSDTLLITKSRSIDKIYYKNGEWLHEEFFFESLGNTVEDFIIDANHKYLVGISYNRDIWLCDLATGKPLNSIFNSIDYTKGLVYLDPQLGLSDYPGDFVAFGRNGIAFQYRIANEQLIPLGEIAKL